MKRSVTLLVCAAAFFVFAVSALGQTSPTSPRTAENKEAPVTKKRMRGTLLRVDDIVGTITINRLKATVTFYVVPETAIRQAGARCDLKDLRAGDNVTVLYKQDGKRKVAITIVVQRDTPSAARDKARPVKE